MQPFETDAQKTAPPRDAVAADIAEGRSQVNCVDRLY